MYSSRQRVYVLLLLWQIIGIGEEATAGVNSVQSQISQALTDSRTSWDKLSQDVTDRCTQQETSINTELNVTYKHTDVSIYRDLLYTGLQIRCIFSFLKGLFLDQRNKGVRVD